MNRPSWEDYFLALAFLISSRSHDEETKHGCVITDYNHIILGTGYNGFVRGLDDKKLPKKRPDKYPWMIHSESNAIKNCKILPREAGGGIAYVTGYCCHKCFQELVQVGVDSIVMARRTSHGFSELDENVMNHITERLNLIIKIVDVDLKWTTDYLGSFCLNKE